jgi:O-antigen/teichoic acid export membrane protein
MSMAATMLCARFLGPHHYGQLGVIQSTVNLFGLVASLGLGITATKHIAEHYRLDPARAGRVLGLAALTACGTGVFVAALLVAGAPWLSRTALNAPELSLDLQIASIAIFFSAINGYQVGALTGFEAFRPLAVASLIRGLITLPAFVVGILAAGLRGAVVALALVSAINYLVNALVLTRECRLRGVSVSYHLGIEDWRLLYRFSIPVVVAGMSFTPAVWWTNTLLARASGYAQLGVFSAAFQWNTVILFFSGALGNLCLPLLSSVTTERNMAKYVRVLLANFVLTTGSALVLATPVAIGAPFVMSLYGKSFAHADKILLLVCLAAVLTAANTSVGYAIWSLDATVSGVLLALMRGALLVAAAYYWRSHGALGLAGSYAFMASAQTLICCGFMWWLLRRRSAQWHGPLSEPACSFLGPTNPPAEGRWREAAISIVPER